MVPRGWSTIRAPQLRPGLPFGLPSGAPFRSPAREIARSAISETLGARFRTKCVIQADRLRWQRTSRGCRVQEVSLDWRVSLVASRVEEGTDAISPVAAHRSTRPVPLDLPVAFAISRHAAPENPHGSRDLCQATRVASMPALRVLDLFAGAGGLSEGFVRAGDFHTVEAIERNAYAAATFAANHTSTRVYTGDIADWICGDVSAVDVVIGGPPCRASRISARAACVIPGMRSGVATSRPWP